MGLTEFLHYSMEWIEQSGWIGVLWFVVLYTLTCVFFLPGSVLTIGAGAVYGFWFSTGLVTISSTVGAVVNFLTSRYLARNWMLRKLGHNAKFRALEKAVSAEGWRMILISRMSPIVPHSLVSYAAGLIRISFWRFTLASFIGFLPPSAAYTYVGAVVGKALRTSAGVGSHDPVTWTFYGLGLVATLAVTGLTTRIARRSWRTYFAERQPAEESLPASPEEPHDRKSLPEALGKPHRFPG
ncbi:MAG TPA: TVP38/TMEM64 family protein [Terrimicrobiaceae bacterium]